MGLHDLLNTKVGSIIISILLGLGLAALFRKACADNKCIMIKGPEQQETRDYFYKINDTCFKYEPMHSECKEGK